MEEKFIAVGLKQEKLKNRIEERTRGQFEKKWYIVL